MRPWLPARFVSGVVRKVEHEVKHEVKQLEHTAKKVGAKVSHATAELERQAKIDAFLLPVQNSALAHSQAHSRLKAILEYRSAHGQDPEEFLNEMIVRSKIVMNQHPQPFSFASNFLNAIRRGNNSQRLKTEVLLPVQAGSISGTEAWNRVESITSFPVMTSNPPGTTTGFGGDIGAAAVVGIAECKELIGMGSFCPGIYEGVEGSFGVQLGINADFIVEIGFVSPANFGGPYWGIGIAGAYGCGGITSVSWSLPANATSHFPQDAKSFQGFTVGIGAGLELEGAWFLGDGTVRALFPSVSAPNSKSQTA